MSSVRTRSGGKMDMKHAQAIEEVLAELAPRDQLGQWAVRRRQHPKVGTPGP